MKQLVRMLLCVFIALVCVGHASASPPTAWGFPLGVSADQLRAAAGAPESTSKISSGNPVLLGQTIVRTGWVYERDGMRFTVSLTDNRVMGVSVMANDVALGAAETSLLDPIGIPLDGTVSDILIKSGATPSLNAQSVVSIMQALINVSRGPIRMTYNVMNGRILTESVFIT